MRFTAARLPPSPDAEPHRRPAEDTAGVLHAIFSSVQRAGRREPAEVIHVRAVCGSVVLDFTRAELPPSGMIEVEAWSVLGNLEVKGS